MLSNRALLGFGQSFKMFAAVLIMLSLAFQVYLKCPALFDVLIKTIDRKNLRSRFAFLVTLLK